MFPLPLFVLLVLALSSTGCATTHSGMSQPVGNTTRDYILSSAMDGGAGAIIGEEMDEHADEVDATLEGGSVTRVEHPETGETAGFGVVFGSAHFGVGSSELLPRAYRELDSIIQSLNDHPLADVLIVGHTDATGSEDYNQQLSRQRASSAAAYLRKHGVDPSRITLLSRGESDPIASNETDRGRQQNRRVEVAIYASETLRAKASRQARGD